MKPAASAPATDPKFSLTWAREAGLADEIAEQMAKKLTQKKKRRRKAIGTSISAVAIAAFLGLWAIPTHRETSDITTAIAQRQTISLRDGSTAELNARTEMKTDFRYGRRTVHLDNGEAFFSVAKDASHPFLVETPAGTIRVTGTQFNIRLAPDGHAEVTLLEGSVTATSRSGSAAALQPGEQLSWSNDQVSKHPVDARAIASLTAWRKGRVDLDSLTLAEAAARMAEYHGVKIVVSGLSADLTPGGSYPLDDLPGFLESVETVLPVRVIHRSPTEYHLIPR